MRVLKRKLGPGPKGSSSSEVIITALLKARFKTKKETKKFLFNSN